LVGGGAVVGLIEAAAFEDEAGTGAEEAVDGACAGGVGAGFEFRVVHALEDFEAISAGLALVVVGGHDGGEGDLRFEIREEVTALGGI
jgi:hypothetical protein